MLALALFGSKIEGPEVPRLGRRWEMRILGKKTIHSEASVL